MSVAGELRARELLRASAGQEAHDAYVELGFLEVEGDGGRHGYLVSPYRPLVAFDARTRELLCEYCVRFADGDRRLPPADDVLAKWLGIRGGERRLLARANIDRPGRQVDPAQARGDLALLAEWRARRGVDSPAR